MTRKDERRVRRRLRSMLLAGLIALLAPAGAAPAAATGGEVVDVEGMVAQLRADPVLVHPSSTVAPDADVVRAALQDLSVPTYVVVLPQWRVDAQDSGIDGVLLRLVEALDEPRAVVVVVTDAGELQAGQGPAAGLRASGLLDRIVQEHSSVQEFDSAALTSALVEFAGVVAREGQDGGEPPSRSGARAVGVAGLIGVALLAGGVLWGRAQRRARLQAPLTDVDSAGGHW